MTEVIRGVLVLVHAELMSHRINLRTSLASGLPRVIGVRPQLQQVILNLLVNSVEAMVHVTDRARVLTIRSERYEFEGTAGVMVAIQDSGTGISQENLDRVFDAFYTTKDQGF